MCIDMRLCTYTHSHVYATYMEGQWERYGTLTEKDGFIWYWMLRSLTVHYLPSWRPKKTWYTPKTWEPESMAKRLGIGLLRMEDWCFSLQCDLNLTSPFYSVQALSGLVSMYPLKRTICFPIKIPVSVWSTCTNIPRSNVYFTLYLSASWN